MRKTETTEEVSSHPVKNTQLGEETWFDHAGPTEKSKQLPKNGLRTSGLGIKSRESLPQLMNDKPNGKSQLIIRRACLSELP